MSPSPPTNTRGRLSQHYGLGPGLGLGSPLGSSSIPSSPTSVHSSSSAIFERDIEAPPTTTTTTSGTRPNPHHIARGHTTESLEQNVPSVLDSAAEILAAGKGDNVLIIESVTGSGWTSPRSMSSRSPSPLGLLLSIPTSSSSSSSSPPRPTIATSPKINATAASSAAAVDTSEPLTTKRDTAPDYPWSSPTSPHSPPHIPTKRLSFLSYTDLLTSTPTATLPLSTLTTNTNEPPHITTVGNALEGLSHSTTHHLHHPSTSTSPPSSPLATPTPLGFGYDHASSSRSPTPGSGSRNRSNRASAVFLDDLLGGEWQREGLGRGLEERLEGTPTAD
ncbi:hypothetical protein F5876DRAFT_81445 [Lentinula aff. lateritia]|uniref:Uncharacterized protein n=1 Tax=Lentinula aff. lateritia TaxID=2804960 RepID=A0ACC1TLZ6_9AGAR|nr:hypothetical protein F5876DRAFT_81445 [Lentinula aff. lateritia]